MDAAIDAAPWRGSRSSQTSAEETVLQAAPAPAKASLAPAEASPAAAKASSSAAAAQPDDAWSGWGSGSRWYSTGVSWEAWWASRDSTYRDDRRRARAALHEEQVRSGEFDRNRTRGPVLDGRDAKAKRRGNARVGCSTSFELQSLISDKIVERLEVGVCPKRLAFGTPGPPMF